MTGLTSMRPSFGRGAWRRGRLRAAVDHEGVEFGFIPGGAQSADEILEVLLLQIQTPQRFVAIFLERRQSLRHVRCDLWANTFGVDRGPYASRVMMHSAHHEEHARHAGQHHDRRKKEPCRWGFTPPHGDTPLIPAMMRDRAARALTWVKGLFA